MLDYHVHLERGPYTWAWVKQFLEQALRVGIKEVGLVEHLYLFREASHLLYVNDHVRDRQKKHIDDFFSFIYALKEQGLPIKLGLEVDYCAEFSTEIDNFVKQLPVDYLIGSVHYLGDWAFDLDSDWGNRNLAEIYRTYYRTLGEAAASGMFDIIGHTGNIAYFGHHPGPDIETSLEHEFLKQMQKLSVCLEINAGGLYKAAQDVFPRQQLFKTIKDYNIPITLASDAHEPSLVGYAIQDKVLPALREAGFDTVYGFTQRKRKAYFLLE